MGDSTPSQEAKTEPFFETGFDLGDMTSETDTFSMFFICLDVFQEVSGRQEGAVAR